jgi:hypothetical protein
MRKRGRPKGSVKGKRSIGGSSNAGGKGRKKKGWGHEAVGGSQGTDPPPEAPPGSLDGEEEEDGCCPSHVHEWARAHIKTLKPYGTNAALWPDFIKLVDNPSIFGRRPTLQRYYMPEKMIFWAPEIFWAQ